MKTPLRRSFSLKERTRFIKKLSFLLEAGLPFLQALYFVMEREDKPKINKHIKEVIKRIQAGMALHKSFNIPPLLIDRESLGVIESGEATGSLSRNCALLSKNLETRLENRNRLVNALIYPGCIALFASILIAVLLLFVFPKILPLIVSDGGRLPVSTKILIASSVFLKEKGIGVIAGTVATYIGISLAWKRRPSFRRRSQEVFFVAPFISHPIKLIKARSFTKLISLFLGCGHTLFESLQHACGVEDNLAYKERIMAVAEQVRGGRRFSKALQNSGSIFPAEMAQFAAMGEESGNLSKILDHVSMIFDEEIKELEKRMCALIEPALMLILGTAVGFIALSLITPIYSLTSTLNQASP